ncbi:MAG: hypothetical protein Q9185_004337 [Variospora sp. 1 TL-2023]
MSMSNTFEDLCRHLAVDPASTTFVLDGSTLACVNVETGVVKAFGAALKPAWSSDGTYTFEIQMTALPAEEDETNPAEPFFCVNEAPNAVRVLSGAGQRQGTSRLSKLYNVAMVGWKDKLGPCVPIRKVPNTKIS